MSANPLVSVVIPIFNDARCGVNWQHSLDSRYDRGERCFLFYAETPEVHALCWPIHWRVDQVPCY